MAKDSHGNGLAYVGDEGTVSVYHMWIENRVVLHVRIDNNDPQLRIGFRSPTTDLADDWPMTRYRDGRAVKTLHSYKVGPDDADVEVREHIDSLSVQQYVYARLPWLLADVYVPKVNADA